MSVFELPRPTESDVDCCSYEVWSRKFPNFALKSKVIPLEEDFVQFLNEDGVNVYHESQGY